MYIGHECIKVKQFYINILFSFAGLNTTLLSLNELQVLNEAEI